jgi:hypothetical protein
MAILPAAIVSANLGAVMPLQGMNASADFAMFPFFANASRHGIVSPHQTGHSPLSYPGVTPVS